MMCRLSALVRSLIAIVADMLAKPGRMTSFDYLQMPNVFLPIQPPLKRSLTPNMAAHLHAGSLTAAAQMMCPYWTELDIYRPLAALSKDPFYFFLLFRALWLVKVQFSALSSV
jgi:hypothetical protein